jgi:hypothetical protein
MATLKKQQNPDAPFLKSAMHPCYPGISFAVYQGGVECLDGTIAPPSRHIDLGQVHVELSCFTLQVGGMTKATAGSDVACESLSVPAAALGEA